MIAPVTTSTKYALARLALVDVLVQYSRYSTEQQSLGRFPLFQANVYFTNSLVHTAVVFASSLSTRARQKQLLAACACIVVSLNGLEVGPRCLSAALLYRAIIFSNHGMELGGQGQDLQQGDQCVRRYQRRAQNGFNSCEECGVAGE
ncbi:hypothetical protein PTNB73_10327 [Pyrenophora teres f. teres]|nr:hypothetical protein HRS9122_08355 [Pyrenophora teres f. teres]KAE8854678.1 hypothetical protein PTNB73_10327 [Pyrenophora teres f. teres]